VTIDQAVERLQFAYPQIYYACHTRHERRRSTDQHLSMRDSQILVHLDRRVPLTLGALAAHMDLAASTLSEAISHLESHGYVLKTQARDRRRVALLLTPKGVNAVRATSVLLASAHAAPALERERTRPGDCWADVAYRRLHAPRETQASMMR
jgi:DNA-binding MarR family transcriptional regulator